MNALEPVDAPQDTIISEEEISSRAAIMDQHVGTRIRERRTMLGISQQQLAQTIGVTYQQAHKYERGLNRISAGRLYEIALALGVNVNWLFEGLVDEPLSADLTARQRMCLELARNFAAIDNAKHQEALSQLARALAVQSAPRQPLGSETLTTAADGQGSAGAFLPLCPVDHG